MSTELPLKCHCGRVRGVITDVTTTSGNRVVCYCKDCQAFAHFLERAEILDEHGGSDIYQIAGSRLRITDGADAVRCVRLSDKGLFRWYADCCRTPIGNTVSGRVPFIGVIDAFIPLEGRALDDAIGAPVGYIHGREVTGGVPAHAHPRVPPRLVVRVIRKMLGWWLTGKSAPPDLFDPKTKAPRVAPRVLTREERAAIATR